MQSILYWPILITGTFFVGCLWRTGSFSWPRSTMKASISLDLSLPVQTPPEATIPNRTSRRSAKPRKKTQDPLSRYMLELYNRKPNSDVVRAVRASHVSGPTTGGVRIVEFPVPSTSTEETLESAELLGPIGSILRVESAKESKFDQILETEGSQRSRIDSIYRAFDVTAAVSLKAGKIVRLRVRGRARKNHWEGPVLLLRYNKPKRRKRRRRSVSDEDQEDLSRWEDDGGRKRRRNSCRRRPMYVDFSLIAYDEWVVAPPGYEAYQCAGKCFYPLGDHLSPTKHAVVQTLVHGALQGSQGGKPVGRACCVPTKLAPTSLLYLDDSGTLTYQYGYEDMVVAECGCR